MKRIKLTAGDLTQDHMDATIRIAGESSSRTLVEPVGFEGDSNAVELIVSGRDSREIS